MKVTISCAERFHSYNLAAQLHLAGYLDQLITTYPVKQVTKFNVPENHVKSLVYWEVIKRSWEKLARWTGSDVTRLYPWLHELFDRKVAGLIPDNTSFFIGWSARSELSIKRTHDIGGIAVLERGSSHIGWQTDLLQEEYDRYYQGRKKRITHPDVIEKELREYELTDYISVPSSFVKRTFLEKGFPEDRIIQNAYGVDLHKFSPGAKPDKTFRVIYVGQMSLRKGVHYLLEAFDSLKLKNAELLLVGSMTDEIKPYYKKYSTNVRYVGIQPQDQLKSFYNQSSVFAICSIEEGMAMVQAQAMACGLPMICTTNTGGDDLIRDGQEGFIIPIRNVDAIKEKLQWMYDHQEEAGMMGKAARERVINGFTWNDYGNRYVMNLQRIEASKNGAR